MTTALYTSLSFSSAVQVVDPASDSVVSSISTGSSPYYEALTPDLTKLVVVIGSGLQVISLPGGSSLHSASLTSGAPVVASDATAYVCGSGQLTTLGLSAPWTVGAVTMTGFFPFNLVLSRDQSKIYVTGFSTAVWVVDVAMGTASLFKTLIGVTVAKGLAISPHGDMLYIGVHGGVVPLSLPSGTQGTLISTAALSVIDDIQIGQSGNTLWAHDSHAVTYQPIPTPAGPAGATTAITHAGAPQTGAITPDELKLYVTDRQTIGHLQIINTTSGLVTGSVSVGNTPLAVLTFPSVTIPGTAADTLAFGDAATRLDALPRGVADSILFGDSALHSGVGFGIAADNIFFADGVAQRITDARTAADAIAFTDHAAGALPVPSTTNIVTVI